MSAYNQKMSKYLDFDPKLTAQNIKRARDDLEAAIVKYYNVLGLPAFAGIPVVDSQRGVIGIEVFTKCDFLKRIFDENLENVLLAGLQDGMVEILTKVKAVGEGASIQNDEESRWYSQNLHNLSFS